MSFCWFTSSIGYPNFISANGRGHELAETFKVFVEAVDNGLTYAEAKTLFPELDPSQVETKKAAFQEFGLLFVEPGSNQIIITPLGKQVYELYINDQRESRDIRTILLALSQALSRYQFNNPLPVGGNRYRARAASSDVRPYLAIYYIMLKLDGVITLSEIFGIVFGIQTMNELPTVVNNIVSQRGSGVPFPSLPQLPANTGTTNNLKIYFMSHASLDLEIIRDRTVNYYGVNEQGYEITELGYEIIESVLDQEWSDWRNGASPPVSVQFATIQEYFMRGIGLAYSQALVNDDYERSVHRNISLGEGVVSIEELEALKQLTKREFEEGRQKLVTHTRLEKTRNQALVRSKKNLTKQIEGHLKCVVCDFDFYEVYGERGQDYIEAHHIEPISQLTTTTTLTIDDLALVCSNCHRMLHQRPWIDIGSLRDIVTQHRIQDTAPH